MRSRKDLRWLFVVSKPHAREARQDSGPDPDPAGGSAAHCFAFYGAGPRTPRPAAALKAFEDTDRFVRRYLQTQPRPLAPGLVKHVPVGSS